MGRALYLIDDSNMPMEQITSPLGTFKVIPKSKVPQKRKQSSVEWEKVLNSIPVGHALTATEKQLGIRAQSLKNKIDSLKEDGKLKGKYDFTTRTIDGTLTVYVTHVSGEGDTES